MATFFFKHVIAAKNAADMRCASLSSSAVITNRTERKVLALRSFSEEESEEEWQFSNSGASLRGTLQA